MQTDGSGLLGLIASETAFAQRARTSVREAFLDVLSEDAVILTPAPVAGRAHYQSSPEPSGALSWYPAMADIAGSGDLGFTTGPWTYRSAAEQAHGHFLSIWRRDAAARWRVTFDGGIAHPAPSVPEAPELTDPAAPPRSPEAALDGAAAVQAVEAFQSTSQQDGFAPALRTYGRNAGFVLLTDNQEPLGLGEADRYLTEHSPAGQWSEAAGARSQDSSLVYSVGMLRSRRAGADHAYAQIWQYDAKVANWGLRVLLLTAVVSK